MEAWLAALVVCVMEEVANEQVSLSFFMMLENSLQNCVLGNCLRIASSDKSAIDSCIMLVPTVLIVC